MERVGTLINKLREQFDQQAGNDKLAITAQLLLAELQAQTAPPVVPGKVSVVLPKFSVAPAAVIEKKEEAPAEVAASTPSPLPIVTPEPANWMFEAPAEIPTLTQQAVVEKPAVAKEIIGTVEPMVEFNLRFADQQKESLNEKLKEEKVEVAQTLQGAPIRDLKKAIGINDRFLFVNDLFRGDENMYERSIKTINGFNIYAEAQYWIQRELKVKLSWPDNSETVKLFDQLIKRRFA